MPCYDASIYDPPAPVAIVSLRASAGGSWVRDVRLLIDTGADITLLPRSGVSRLRVVPQSARYELIGFDGSRRTSQAVELDMLFRTMAFRGRYLLTDDDQGILGRDVLCAVKLLLDGPNQEWSEL
jgi:hypothetical protein